MLITPGEADGSVLDRNPGISVTGDWLTASMLTDELLEHSWRIRMLQSIVEQLKKECYNLFFFKLLFFRNSYFF